MVNWSEEKKRDFKAQSVEELQGRKLAALETVARSAGENNDILEQIRNNLAKRSSAGPQGASSDLARLELPSEVTSALTSIASSLSQLAEDYRVVVSLPSTPLGPQEPPLTPLSIVRLFMLQPWRMRARRRTEAKRRSRRRMLRMRRLAPFLGRTLMAPRRSPGDFLGVSSLGSPSPP